MKSNKFLYNLLVIKTKVVNAAIHTNELMKIRFHLMWNFERGDKFYDDACSRRRSWEIIFELKKSLRKNIKTEPRVALPTKSHFLCLFVS